MPICPECDSAYIEGDVFCGECGHPLGSAHTTTTGGKVDPPPVPSPWETPAPTATSAATNVAQPVAAPFSGSPMPVTVPKPRLVLSNGHEIELGLGSVVIGRSDEASNWKVPIDLETILGEVVIADGLSRKHAEIAEHGGQYTITDLDGPNRTRVDGVSIQPLVPVTLIDGQEIKLGKVALMFRSS